MNRTQPTWTALLTALAAGLLIVAEGRAQDYSLLGNAPSLSDKIADRTWGEARREAFRDVDQRTADLLDRIDHNFGPNPHRDYAGETFNQFSPSSFVSSPPSLLGCMGQTTVMAIPECLLGFSACVPLGVTLSQGPGKLLSDPARVIREVGSCVGGVSSCHSTTAKHMATCMGGQDAP